MTVGTETFWNGPTTANGSQTEFGFTFPCVQASDVVVLVNGAVSAGPFTVTFTDPTNPRGGGKVTYETPHQPSAGAEVVLVRRLALLQATSLPSPSVVTGPAVENAIDLLTMLVQQVAKRALLAPDIALVDGFSGALPDPAEASAGHAIVLNSDRSGFIFGAPASVTVAAAWTSVLQQATIALGLTEAGFSADAQAMRGHTFAQMRSDLSLGTAALVNTGTSGATVALCSGANAWSSKQSYGVSGSGAVSGQFLENCFQQYGSGSNRKLLLGSNAGVFSGYVFTAADGFQGTALSWDLEFKTFGFDGPLYPLTDDARDLGTASFRWDNVYATNATIQTSDAGEKTDLEPIPESVKRAVRAVMQTVGVFRWRSSVAAKGDNARLHVGITAQALRDAFIAEGEDPERWGVFCSDPIFELVERSEEIESDDGVSVRRWLEERPKLDAGGVQAVRLGVRYEQLMMLALASAV